MSKILSNILRDLYSIRPPALASRVTLSAKYSRALHEWRRELSRFLDADTVDASLLIPAFQRQRNVLNLAYYHALILVYRPFLLSNFASLNSRKDHPRGAPGTLEMDKNVADCLDAAMNITTIVNELCEAGQLYRAFWVCHSLNLPNIVPGLILIYFYSSLNILHFALWSFSMCTQSSRPIPPMINTDSNSWLQRDARIRLLEWL